MSARSSSPQALRLVKQEPAQRGSSESGQFVAVRHAGTIGTPRKCTREQGAAILSQALRSTMGVVGASVTDVAFWCDTDRRTVQRWLSSDATVAVECVVRSSRLWATFSREVDRLREEAGLVRKAHL